MVVSTMARLTERRSAGVPRGTQNWSMAIGTKKKTGSATFTSTYDGWRPTRQTISTEGKSRSGVRPHVPGRTSISGWRSQSLPSTKPSDITPVEIWGDVTSSRGITEGGRKVRQEKR